MDPNQNFLHPDSDSEKTYHRKLKPWQRLYLYYTESSLQKHVQLKSSCTMKDRLDFILSATYQHNKELFPDELDIYLQPITVGLVVKKPKKRISDVETKKQKTRRLLDELRTLILAKRIYPEHPLIIGGIKERIHPSSIKLMNSSHHQPQTNAGYVRQDRDGNVFQY